MQAISKELLALLAGTDSADAPAVVVLVVDSKENLVAYKLTELASVLPLLSMNGLLEQTNEPIKEKI